MDITYTQPNGNTERWTRLAIDCYKRHCICQGCEYKDYFTDGTQCHMKNVVLSLVRKFGVPQEEERNL